MVLEVQRPRAERAMAREIVIEEASGPTLDAIRNYKRESGSASSVARRGLQEMNRSGARVWRCVLRSRRTRLVAPGGSISMAARNRAALRRCSSRGVPWSRNLSLLFERRVSEQGASSSLHRHDAAPMSRPS